MFRFLHAADIHLDSPLRGLERFEDAPGDEIRGATRRALAALVDLAIAEGVAFVLIAGDLYDGDWKCYNTGIFFVQQMLRLREAGIDVVLIQGNHDAESKMTRALSLPDNVTVLTSDRPQTFRLDRWETAIHGQGFATQKVTQDLSLGYPPRVPGWFNIGLLHTCAEGREGHERYAPCSIEGLRSKGYDYWALGHIHRREVLATADPWIVFPGNIQGRHIRESGPKGCTLIEVSDRREVLGLDARELGVVRWEWCRVDAVGSPDGEDLLGRFADRLDDLIIDSPDRLMAIRVQVSGSCPAHAAIAAQPERWSHEFRRVARERGDGRLWVEAVKLATRSTEELDAVFAPDGPLGELSALVESVRSDEQRLLGLASELAELRKRLLPHDLGTELGSPAQLREILETVVPLLHDRLGGGGERR